VKTLAHRGASGYAPENTDAAFDLAIEMDADGIETDLRLTRDGVVVLFHDPTVDRNTDGRGEVASLNFRDLQVLDAGRWFHPRFGGLRIPDLRSFLRRYMGRTSLELELKVPHAVEPALDEVQRAGLWAGVVFTSFQYPVLEAVRRRASWVAVGWLVERITPDAVAAIRAVDGVQICPRASTLTRADVRLAHRYGLRVRAWGISDGLIARRAIACGADGATVDRPDWPGSNRPMWDRAIEDARQEA
jgi:glycerophosphoryl diester phosphodiesterase